MELTIETAEEMESLGARVAGQSPRSAVIYLLGDLGAGKTTFVRGFLAGLGYCGTVKSPTYTLVESYMTDAAHVQHFDLYRLNDPRELDDIGVRDYVDGGGILLVEWPERGGDRLPSPDLRVSLEILGGARKVIVDACSAPGTALVRRLQASQGVTEIRRPR